MDKKLTSIKAFARSVLASVMFVVMTDSSIAATIKNYNETPPQVEEFVVTTKKVKQLDATPHRYPLEKEISCMANSIYYEARGESYEGKLAVATVIMNRTNSDKFPSSICGVTYQAVKGKYQFSWVKTTTKKKSSDDWDLSVELAKKVIFNQETHAFLQKSNALYFHSVHAKPRWKFKKIARIGNHIFY